MEKIIWIIGNDRLEVIDVQRKINSSGSMKAFCMLTFDALNVAVEERLSDSFEESPSLILVDYATEKNDARYMEKIGNAKQLSGVPVFFICSNVSEEIDEECYQKGAIVVLHKPITEQGVLRIERAAWQYENTRRYERFLQEQALEIRVAREIRSLNKQLENRNQFLYKIFGKYFPDEVLEVILNTPDGDTIGGVRKQMAVLCSDLRGFSSIAEEMQPEAMTSMLNVFFGKMTDIIVRFKGIVIEFMGDGILAVFGAMSEGQDFRQNALAAAVCMQNALLEVNEFCKNNNYPLLEMGIGIQCGEAFIGNVGSERMMRYNVLGSVVNESSRIESYSVGGQILVSDEMVAGLEDTVQIRNMTEFAAKGIKRSIRVYDFAGICHDGTKYYIKNTVKDVMRKVSDNIVFGLTKVNGKVLDINELKLKPATVSKQEACLYGDEALIGQFDVFDNVLIRAFDENGMLLFEQVYAKITEKHSDMIKIRFTHINYSFSNFIKE